MAPCPPHAPDPSAADDSHNLNHLDCPTCGAALSPDRILDAQFRALSQKHQGAVDRLADYEDEIRRLKTQAAQPQRHHSSSAAAAAAALASAHQDPALALLTPSTTRTSSEEAARPSTANPALPSRASRFSSFLSRKAASSSNVPAAAASSNVPAALPRQSDDDELRGALEKEKGLRARAEGKLNAMSAEMEDLSVTLFQQANEMVAEERRARAKLEDRVDVLEKRDQDKRRRLDRLENAMKRIERVRGLLGT